MTARDKFIVVALIGLMAIVSVAAVFVDQAERTGVAPAFGGSYIEGVIGAPQYLDPILAATDVDADVVQLVFAGLTQLDRDGTVIPDLASFTTDTDGKVWTFTIRDDARWQDGEPVTAQDVIYTVSLVQDKAYVGPFSDAFRGVKADAVGPKIVRFTLPEAFGSFAANTTLPLLPSHRLAGVTYNDLPLVLPRGVVPSGPVRSASSRRMRARSCSRGATITTRCIPIARGHTSTGSSSVPTRARRRR